MTAGTATKEPRRRVLSVVGWWPAEGSVAGIFIKEHVLALAANCDQEVIHMQVVKGTSFIPTTQIHYGMEDGVPTHRVTIRTRIRRFGLYGFLIRRAYAALVQRLHRIAPFDLIHVHVRTEVTEEILPIANALDLPVVVTEHNSYYHLGIKQLPAKEQARERQRIKQWFLDPRIKWVMPVSKDLGRVLRNDFGVEDARLVIIPNVASAHFVPGTAPKGSGYRMMLAAVWRPPKDPDVFIDALLRLPSGSLSGTLIDWVGYGPDMERIRQRCTVELEGLDIRFPGALSKAQMAAHMQQADLFVLPTKADNLPCVVIESLCCGIPVLSMAVNGVPELVDHSNGELVPPNDPEALSAALRTWINGEHTTDRNGIAARAHATYSALAVRRSILQVYDKALAVN